MKGYYQGRERQSIGENISKSSIYLIRDLDLEYIIHKELLNFNSEKAQVIIKNGKELE